MDLNIFLCQVKISSYYYFFCYIWNKPLVISCGHEVIIFVLIVCQWINSHWNVRLWLVRLNQKKKKHLPLFLFANTSRHSWNIFICLFEFFVFFNNVNVFIIYHRSIYWFVLFLFVCGWQALFFSFHGPSPLFFCMFLEKNFSLIDWLIKTRSLKILIKYFNLYSIAFKKIYMIVWNE